MNRLTATLNKQSKGRHRLTTARCLFVAVCFLLVSMTTQAQRNQFNFDPTLDSSDFFGVASIDHRNSYVVSRHWWDGVSSINITGLNNDELYASAQSLRDTSMSLNHKLLNYHWLTSWHNLGNNSLIEDNNKKILRKTAHLLLSYTWDGYRNHSASTSSKPSYGQLNIKYRVRVNHDKAKLSLSIGF